MADASRCIGQRSWYTVHDLLAVLDANLAREDEEELVLIGVDVQRRTEARSLALVSSAGTASTEAVR